MNEILQKKTEEAAMQVPFERGTRESFRDGATFILSHLWISVEEALPTERDEEDEQYSTNVFARTKDCIRYAYYDFYNESWCSVEGGYRFGGDVTHWMPIPSLEGGEEW